MVSKELIEKYHLNVCSPEEKQEVEEWLFSNDTDDLQLPEGENKENHKRDIWEGIKAILPEEEQPVLPMPETKIVAINTALRWKKLIAACLTFAILGFAAYKIIPGNNENQLSGNPDATVSLIRHIESKNYNIAVGPKTQANIDHKTGDIDFSGSILISPKEDIELTFKGIAEKMSFKGGQTYIALTGEPGKDRVIIVNKKNLMDLPPLLQKLIINEFSI